MFRRLSVTSTRSVSCSTFFGLLFVVSALCAFEVTASAAPDEIKFVGTALRQEFNIGTLSWIVSVDQLLSGPTFCPSPITVIIGGGVLPAGYVDPNVTVGDKVEVYGEVEMMFWDSAEGGGVICTVFLSQSYHYFRGSADPCQLDSDRDGVPDCRDRCANTPPGTRVDQNGCPVQDPCQMDSDRDGVPDCRDRCANTPPGTQVDEFGCPVASAPFIRDWLICGSFTFGAGDAQSAFNSDYISEIAVQPSTGEACGGKTWRSHHSPEDFINFDSSFSPNDYAVAYAHVYVSSPRTQAVQLRVGSDDAIKVWLNGGLVHENFVNRGHAKDQDIKTVTLNEGWNRLLIKVLDWIGGWGFYARFTNTDGSEVQGLTYQLDNPTPSRRDSDGDGIPDDQDRCPYEPGPRENNGCPPPENKPPIADFSITPANPRAGEPIYFTDKSYDPDGSVVSWRWNFGDGATSTGKNPTHSYSETKTYSICLTVTDDDGATSKVCKDTTITPQAEAKILWEQQGLTHCSLASLIRDQYNSCWKFKTKLEQAGYSIDIGVVTRADLNKYKVVVIPQHEPDEWYVKAALPVIQKYVAQGGNLLLLGDFRLAELYGSDYVQKVAQTLGVEFARGYVVQDSQHHAGRCYSYQYHSPQGCPRVDQILDHSITQGVQHIYLGIGTYIKEVGSAIVLAETDVDSWADKVCPLTGCKRDKKNGPLPVLAYKQIEGGGRIVFLSDASVLENWMIDQGDNEQLGLNIINWLAGGGASHLRGGASSIEEVVARLVPNDPAGVSNPDLYIGDQEILKAQQLWITGSPVPGTDGKIIDDAMMMKLLGIWISRRPINQPSGATYQSDDTATLSVEKIGLLPNPVRSAGVVALRVEGTGVAAIKVEVFNLAGARVFEQEASGNTLKFYAVDNRGHPLANGVYLYVITVRSFNGEVIRSEIRKLVILR